MEDYQLMAMSYFIHVPGTPLRNYLRHSEHDSGSGPTRHPCVRSQSNSHKVPIYLRRHCLQELLDLFRQRGLPRMLIQ